MNIFSFELKAQRNAFLIWTFVILFTLFIFMSGIYPLFKESWDEVQQILNNLPPAFMSAFSLEISFFYSYGGFFSFTFLYLALIGAIMAVNLALSSFARERRSHCADFLLTKPVKRSKIFIAKFLSGLTLLTLSNIIFLIVATFIYIIADQDQELLGQFILAASSLYFTQLVFWAAGCLYAIFSRKIRSVSITATAFGFAAFILSLLYNILEEEVIRFIAPLRYFDTAKVFLTGGFEIRYVATAIFLFIAFIILSYFRFLKSDVNAV